MIKSNKQMSNDRSSNNGSVSMMKRRKKVSLQGNESFLDISALHDSFLSSESQENEEMSSSDYDSSNPYTTSSDSSLEQEKIIKITQKSKRGEHIGHRRINKKILLIDIIIQNYPLSPETLRKFEISTLEASLFIILKVLQNNIKDFKVLYNATFGNPIPLEKQPKSDPFEEKRLFREDSSDKRPLLKDDLFAECRLEELEEITPIVLEKFKHIFIINCSEFLNQTLTDEEMFPLFRAIVESIKEFNYSLLSLNLEVLLHVLKEKKYEILKFLIEKREIRLAGGDEREIANFLLLNNYNDINKSKSFKKMLTPNAKINLELVILYYISESPDHYIVKEITKALLDTDTDIYQQINFSNNLNFSLISENLEYVWFCTSNPDFNLHHWLQDSETQSLLASSLSYSEGKNFEYTLYFLNKIEIWSDEKLTKSMANTIYQRLEVPSLENVLYTFYNPLKVIILLIEFLTNLSRKVVYNRSMLLTIINKIHNLARHLLSKLSDDRELSLILRDLDLEQRRVIYIIYENNLWELVSLPNVENVIDILWNGSISSEFSPLSFFSVSSNIFLSHSGLNYPRKENLYFARKAASDYQAHFTFQRVVWTYNCRIRLVLDNCLLMLCLFFTVVGIEIIQETRIFYFNEGMQDENDPLFARFVAESQSTFKQYMFFFIVYLINFPMRLINCVYYAKTQLIRYKLHNEDVLDLTLSALSLIMIVFFLNMHHIPLFQIDIWLKSLFSSFIVLTVFKVFFCFRILRIFGPWMKALWVIFEACMKFMVIFMITLLCFSFLGYISFFNCPNGRYSSLIDTFYYYLEVSGSQFDFADYQSYKIVFGPTLLIFFIFVINIIYMNLIIAILSYNFEAASRVGRVHFNHGLIGSIRKFEYDPDYGCLVVMPFYLSFLNLGFLFAAIFTENIDKLKKINKILCRFGYIPISITIITLLLALNLALIPCYYVLNYMRIVLLALKNPKTEHIPLVFQWITLGIPLMLWQTLSDAYHTFIYLWFAKKLISEENKGISNLTYHILCKTLSDMYKKGLSICEFHQVIEFMNKEEKNTPIRLLEKSSVFRNFCSFHVKNRNSPSLFLNTPTPFMGSHEKYNAVDIIKNSNVRDPDQLLDFLGKFTIVTKEIDEVSKEHKKVVIVALKNILKIMKWYSKTSTRLANYQLLYDAIRKIEA